MRMRLQHAQLTSVADDNDNDDGRGVTTLRDGDYRLSTRPQIGNVERALASYTPASNGISHQRRATSFYPFS